DDVECVFRLAAVRCGVGQRADDLVELVNGTGPAVDEDQRQGVLLLRPHVDEVDGKLVDLGYELRQLVEFTFLGPPVVFIFPVGDEILHVAQIDPVIPTRFGNLIREARAGETILQVAQHGVVHRDLERLDRVGCRLIIGTCRESAEQKNDCGGRFGGGAGIADESVVSCVVVPEVVSGGIVQARIGFTSSPWTSVSRKWRPWYLYVSLVWSMPRQWRMVAFRSWTCTGSFATL